MIYRAAADVLVAWDDPAVPTIDWNVYRDGTPDTTGWGAAHATTIGDAEPGTPGIQYRDTNAVLADPLLFYLATATSTCGESPLR